MLKHNPGFVDLVNDAKNRIQEISLEDMQQKLSANFQGKLIDVREESEWNKKHIPNAVHLSKGVIEVKIESAVPDKATEIILYCGGGSRSALVADNLQKMGYNNVYSLIGGFRDWDAEN